jgi:hypothetical protein
VTEEKNPIEKIGAIEVIETQEIKEVDEELAKESKRLVNKWRDEVDS